MRTRTYYIRTIDLFAGETKKSSRVHSRQTYNNAESGELLTLYNFRHVQQKCLKCYQGFFHISHYILFLETNLSYIDTGGALWRVSTRLVRSRPNFRYPLLNP